LCCYHLYDPDHPIVVAQKEDVGRFGAPLISLKDYEDLLEGIPIEKYYCHPGGAPVTYSPFAHACYFTLAKKKGVPLNQLRGPVKLISSLVMSQHQ
jgi:methylmalonyl-CoA mutase N-terminal domain/subunit